MTDTKENLWQRVTSQDALQMAWTKVAANEGSAGGDGISIREFSANLFSNLTELRAELLQGIYRSGPFRKVSIPKKKPGYRILTIPSVRDRVVHSSLAAALTPVFEPVFSDGSFAYRANRGVADAAARIERWRNKGYSIVIEADVVSYFDNIVHALLLEKLRKVLGGLPGSETVLALLQELLAEQAAALGTPGRGVVQGSPLSPLLANLYLDALDDEMDEMGVKMVRFADDFVILCKSQKKAGQAFTHCVRILESHGLKLHQDGTRIVNFDMGFDFIGYLFLRSLAIKEKRPEEVPPEGKPPKSVVTDEGIIELGPVGSRFDPGRRVLYVLSHEHVLTIRNRSFSVQRDDGIELIAIPHHRIGRIEVGPAVTFARPVIDLALDANICISIVDGFGQTRGNIARDVGKQAGNHFDQASSVLSEGFRADIAKYLVRARIGNQRLQLMRLSRGKENENVQIALESMLRLLHKLDVQVSTQECLGIEGAAGALYWPALGSLLAENDQCDRFERTRPAADPPNAVINYLTGILERDTRAAIQSVGLHPGFAFLHGSRNNHDGLVFDLMEPFRAPLTEGLAIFLFNSHRVKANMFQGQFAGGIQISAEGRKAIVQGYESAVAKRVNKPDGSGKLTWRTMMRHQASLLLRAIRKNDPKLFCPYFMED